MKRLFILAYGSCSYISFLIGFCFLFLLLMNIGIHNMQNNNSASGIKPWLINNRLFYSVLFKAEYVF